MEEKNDDFHLVLESSTITPEEEKTSESSRFRGFGENVSYVPTNTKQGSICKACPNLCQLHYIEIPSAIDGKSKRLIYGDACDRYQNKGKKVEIKEIEDLIDYRSERLQRVYPLAPQAEKLASKNINRKIGIPKGLQYWTDFPFWSTFLKSLGLSLVVSNSITPNSFENANRVTNVDSCLPLKMYYELVGDLIDNPEVTDIFIPSIYNLNPLGEKTEKSYLCPLVSSVNQMVILHFSPGNHNDDDDIHDFNHNKRFLTPELFFDVRYSERKSRILSRKLIYGKDNAVLEQLYAFACPEFEVSKKMVKTAYDTARKAQKVYLMSKRKKGEEVLAELKEKKEHAIVLFGRSYNSFDKTLNMKLDVEIRRLGWQVIPFDFLPLEEAKLTESEYNNNNWFFQGNLLAGAQIVKENPLLHGIYISNFKCGADGFIIKDMERTLPQAGKFMVLEIDDLINGTGYRTRIEAFIRSITLANQKAMNSNSIFEDSQKSVYNMSLSKDKPVRYTEDDLRTMRVMVPSMSDHSILIVGALRSSGIEAMYFPPVSDPEMEMGRSMSNGKECLPYTITAGEIIAGLEREVKKGHNPNRLAVIWAITEGQCRFNQYGYSHQFNIDQRKELFGAKLINLVNKDSTSFNAFTPKFKLLKKIVKSYVTGDYLQQMLHQTRPYEIHTNEIVELKKAYKEKILSIPDEDMNLYFPPNALQGDIRHLKLTDMIYQVYIRKISDVMGDNTKFEETVMEFLVEIKKVPLNKSRKRPLIGIVGEIYLRFNPFGNGDLVRQLESLGAEAHLAPFTELIYYGTHKLKALGDSHFGKIFENINNYLVNKLDMSVFELFKDSLSRPDFGQGRDAEPIVRYGRQYVGMHCAGEGPLTLGAIEDYCRHGADGMIMIGPLGCLPNITFKGLFEQVRDFLPEHLKDMPRMEITVSESLNFKNIRTRIEPFVNQAKDYLDNKQ